MYMDGEMDRFPDRLLETVQECEAMCEHTHRTVLMTYSRGGSRARQLSLLHDCADICTLMAKYLARHTQFARPLARLCAQICEVCGEECLRYSDSVSQECGQVCLDCAEECRNFARGRML